MVSLATTSSGGFPGNYFKSCKLSSCSYVYQHQPGCVYFLFLSCCQQYNSLLLQSLVGSVHRPTWAPILHHGGSGNQGKRLCISLNTLVVADCEDARSWMTRIPGAHVMPASNLPITSPVPAAVWSGKTWWHHHPQVRTSCILSCLNCISYLTIDSSREQHQYRWLSVKNQHAITYPHNGLVQ